MERQPTVTEPKFDTTDHRLLDIWNSLQRLQTDFCFAQEVSVYYASEAWTSSVHSVLDVGTGNGYFLHRLARCFPNKDYLGIDSSAELIALARATPEATTRDFVVRDYFSASGLYDCVIMRLFWQHLETSRIEEALDVLTRITQPGSIVIISDAFDEARHFTPDLPSFRTLVNTYAAREASRGRNRHIATQLLEWARSSPSWEVGCHLPLIIPSSIPGNLALFEEVYALWLELFACLDLPGVDISVARRELVEWSGCATGYTQAGLHVVRLDRVD